MKYSLLLFFLIILSCSQKAINKEHVKKEQLIFGSGGGFTGVSSSYKLLRNGEVYRTGNTDTTWIVVGALSPNVTKQLFDNYSVLKFDTITMNDPGNRYYFIEKITNEDQKHKITWGNQPLENKSLAIYHDILMNNIKLLNKKNNSVQ
jgi:hypothetical protein